MEEERSTGKNVLKVMGICYLIEVNKKDNGKSLYESLMNNNDERDELIGGRKSLVYYHKSGAFVKIIDSPDAGRMPFVLVLGSEGAGLDAIEKIELLSSNHKLKNIGEGRYNCVMRDYYGK